MMHIASLVVGIIVALATLARLFEKRCLRFVIHRHLRAKRKWDLLPWECKRGHRSEIGGACRQKVRLSDYTGPYTIRCAYMLHLRPEKALADEGFGAGTIGT